MRDFSFTDKAGNYTKDIDDSSVAEIKKTVTKLEKLRVLTIRLQQSVSTRTMLTLSVFFNTDYVKTISIKL